MGSSVASFLVLGTGGGGGGKPPKYTDRKNCKLYARASERLKTRVSKYICIHTNTINAVPFYYLWRGAIRQYNNKSLLIEKNLWICERASLEKCCVFTLKNYYFLQYSVGTYDTLSQKHILSGLKFIYYINYYKINAVSFYYLWYGTICILVNDSTPTKH